VKQLFFNNNPSLSDKIKLIFTFTLFIFFFSLLGCKNKTHRCFPFTAAAFGAGARHQLRRSPLLKSGLLWFVFDGHGIGSRSCSIYRPR